MNSLGDKLKNPSLNALETLGVLSARIIHSLANHLAVLTGNLCAVGALKDDPEGQMAAWHGAVQAANRAGNLLDRYGRCRKAIHNELGETSLDDLVPLLRSWADRANWSFEPDPKWQGAASLSIPLSRQMIEFVLDSILEQSRGVDGMLRVARSARTPVTAPLLDEPEPAGFAQISMSYRGGNEINWKTVQTELTDFRLTAAYEILSQVRAKPESHRMEEDRCATKFQVPVRYKTT